MGVIAGLAGAAVLRILGCLGLLALRVGLATLPKAVFPQPRAPPPSAFVPKGLWDACAGPTLRPCGCGEVRTRVQGLQSKGACTAPLLTFWLLFFQILIKSIVRNSMCTSIMYLTIFN